MSDVCTWPACACRATGQPCSIRKGKASAKQAKSSAAGKAKTSSTRQKGKGSSKVGKYGLTPKELTTLHKTDAAFYMVIWLKREHKCQNCGAPILYFEFKNFHHLLPKRPDGGYPQYRHKEWNIWILCWPCHDTNDNGNPAAKILVPLRAETKRLLKLHEHGQLDGDQIPGERGAIPQDT